MYIRRKVYSYSEPEEQLYSVTMTEEQLSLFSEFLDAYEEALYSEVDDAAAGVGVAATGLGAAGAAGYGITKGAKALRNKKIASRKAKNLQILKEGLANDKQLIEAGKASQAAGKEAALDTLTVRNKNGFSMEVPKSHKQLQQDAKNWEKALANETAERQRATKRVLNKMKKEGTFKQAGALEKAAAKVARTGDKVGKFIGKNKKAAAGVTAGTLAAAGLGNAIYQHNK